MDVTILIPFGPPNSPPTDFLLLKTNTKTARAASEQNIVTLNARLLGKKDTLYDFIIQAYLRAKKKKYFFWKLYFFGTLGKMMRINF